MVETVQGILRNKGGEVWSLPPDATVYEAIEKMAKKSAGALLVVSPEGELIGIISERDYARKVILKGKSSRETQIRQIMSSPVTTVSSDWKTDDCLRLMTDKHIRHLPVVDDGRLVGVVSIGDLVKAKVSLQEETIQHLTEYIAGRRA